MPFGSLAGALGLVGARRREPSGRLSRGLDAARRRDGGLALRSGLRDARAHLRRQGAPADHRADARGRLCLDGELARDLRAAAVGRLAGHLSGLCGAARASSRRRCMPSRCRARAPSTDVQPARRRAAAAADRARRAARPSCSWSRRSRPTRSSRPACRRICWRSSSAPASSRGTVVMIGALFGPSQVAARLCEFIFARNVHPLADGALRGRHCWSRRSRCCGCSDFRRRPRSLFAIMFGVANGLITIARGAVPLALFGAVGYGRIIGRIAGPALIVTAVAPLVIAFVAERASDPARARASRRRSRRWRSSASCWSAAKRRTDRAERRKRVRRARQRRARKARVVVHAPHQRVDRVEFQLRPDPADERDVDRRAVEIAGKIEHMHLEQRRAVVEGRPRAEARDAVADHAADPDAHRIDAVLQPAIRIERDVRGRKAEVAPALVALDHRAGREPRIAEQFGGLDHAALGQRGADRGRRDRAALVLQRRRGLDREAVALALFGEERRRAAALMAEMKVEADGRAADAEPADQNARDEFLRASAPRTPHRRSAPARRRARSRRAGAASTSRR